MTQDTPLRIGVVVHDRGDDGEDLLAAFIEELRTRPIRVGGLYQQTVRTTEGPNVMDVVDVQTGKRIRISQPLGSGSSSCCLDPTGLAEAARAPAPRAGKWCRSSGGQQVCRRRSRRRGTGR